jgi:fermentation-respiration switch protein FrsA (DUF1100 family)
MAFFDAFRLVSLIGCPLLMTVGREAITSWTSVEAFQNAQRPKELRWIDGASHNDLYDKEQYVAPTIAKLTEFYTANLAELVVA